jgi:hypothetical protein
VGDCGRVPGWKTTDSRRIFGAMAVLEKWTEVLRCRPYCALTSTADLFGKGIVQTLRLPSGFKAVPTEYGDTFYCRACNRPAKTILK